jgi:ferredoxin
MLRRQLAPIVPRLLGGLTRRHGDGPTGDRSQPLPITYVHPDGRRQESTAYVGQTFLQAAHEAGIVIEAACGGSCACSTCHLYIDPSKVDLLPEASDRELDMLDLAFFPEATSRLGCQITVTRELSGVVVTLPKATRNMAVDGYVAKPH